MGDTSLDRRWPGYASAAAAEGVRSLLSVPLVPAEVFCAAVNLYAPWPHVFTSADITAAARLARQVSSALRLVQEWALRYGGSADLSSAQLLRVLAGLALRTLVRDYGFTEGGALDYLRKVAGGPVPESAGTADITVPVLVPDARRGARRSRRQALLSRRPHARLSPCPSTAAEGGEPRLAPADALAPGEGQAAMPGSFPWDWSGRRTFKAPAHAITWSNRVCRLCLRGRRRDESAVVFELRGKGQRHLGPDVRHLQLSGHPRKCSTARMPPLLP